MHFRLSHQIPALKGLYFSGQPFHRAFRHQFSISNYNNVCAGKRHVRRLSPFVRRFVGSLACKAIHARRGARSRSAVLAGAIRQQVPPRAGRRREILRCNSLITHVGVTLLYTTSCANQCPGMCPPAGRVFSSLVLFVGLRVKPVKQQTYSLPIALRSPFAIRQPHSRPLRPLLRMHQRALYKTRSTTASVLASRKRLEEVWRGSVKQRILQRRSRHLKKFVCYIYKQLVWRPDDYGDAF
ncbi:Hypothetical_protein [Hexamita inflata]|uniref:Hypothetical_protein n=1 Tax=Hexamita inflata TaxID=28002 RepID=A0AA86RGJ0_9EUKA|nr:Hypothetical protein HINF_LOCUS60578 [Hexamita inflata]